MRSDTARFCPAGAAARHYLPIFGSVLLASTWLGSQEGAAKQTSADRRLGAHHPSMTELVDARGYRNYQPDGFFSQLFGMAPRYETRPPPVATYRTLCVRLCDGYYWPMSYATPRGRIMQDQKRCESSCEAPAKLFVHRNPGGSVKYMYDLEGQPYSRLPNAFRYRKEYLEECRCKPAPWSQAALGEYKQRELAAKAEEEAATAQAADVKPAPATKKPSVARWRYRRRPRPRYDTRAPRGWSLGTWLGIE